jgi:SAM-dependent methyltransferase
MDKSWENSISIGNAEPLIDRHLSPASAYLEMDDGSVDWRSVTHESLEAITARDTAPIPEPRDREGYYGENHFNYWASGFCDFKIMQAKLEALGKPLNDYLDMGCASGRVTRHAAAQMPGLNVFGCDINRQHVDWSNEFLPDTVVTFQNTSLPQIAMPDSSLDLVSAFSVFTHIESYDTAWLMEIRRILRPGGIAWITIHGDRTWAEVKPGWPLYEPLNSHPDYVKSSEDDELPEKRLVYRWDGSASYSANVFYRCDHLRKHWGRFFDVEEILPCVPPFQDAVILKKR